MLMNVIIEGVQEDSPLENIRQLTSKFKFLEWEVRLSLDDNDVLIPSLKWIDMLTRVLDNDMQKVVATIDKNVAYKFAIGEMSFLNQFGTICLDFNQDEISQTHIFAIVKRAERYDTQLLTKYSSGKTELHNTIIHEIRDIHEYRVIIENDFFDNVETISSNIVSGERIIHEQESICSRIKELSKSSHDFFLVISLSDENLNDIAKLDKLLTKCLQQKNRYHICV